MTEANKHFLEKYNAKPINELFNSQGFYIFLTFIYEAKTN